MSSQRIQQCLVLLILLLVVVVHHHPVQATGTAEPSVYEAFERENGEDGDGTEEGSNSPSEQADSEEQAEVDEQPLLSDSTQTSIFKLLFQLAFYTGVVLILIYGLVKFLSIRQKKLQSSQVIKVLGGTSVGSQKSLQLVKVGGKMYLLGVGDQVTLIKEIDDLDDISVIEYELEQQEAGMAKGFLSFLPSSSSPDREPTTSFNQLFKRSLRRQRQRYEINQWDAEETNEQEGRFK